MAKQTTLSPETISGEAIDLEIDAGELSVAKREEVEVQSAIISAKRFPRDENVAYTKIMKSLERPGLAKDALYSFPRGKARVTGPSVKLAREMARCWGNIKYGVRVISVDDDMIHIKGFACDLETNAYVESEDKFARLVYRKSSGWIVPDERDLRELINKRGAILVRNCVLQLLPPDVIEAAEMAAQTTIQKIMNKDLKESRDVVIRTIVQAFDRMGVTVAILEDWLTHPIANLSNEEIIELRQMYNSIREGNSQREDYFPSLKKTAPAPDELNEKLKSASASAKKATERRPGGAEEVKDENQTLV